MEIEPTVGRDGMGGHEVMTENDGDRMLLAALEGLIRQRGEQKRKIESHRGRCSWLEKMLPDQSRLASLLRTGTRKPGKARLLPPRLRRLR